METTTRGKREGSMDTFGEQCERDAEDRANGNMEFGCGYDEWNFDNATEEKPYQPFVIDNDEKADWVLSKLFKWQAEMTQITKQYTEMQTRVQTKMNKFDEHFREQLRHYTEAKVLEAKEGKTVRLLHGNLQLRTVPQSFKVNATVEQMKEVGVQYINVNTTETVNKALYLKDAKKHLVDTGELVALIDVTLPYEKFEIEF